MTEKTPARIACFGEALLDLFLLPVGSGPENASLLKPSVGGASANVAVILARCGISSRFLGSVGPGPFGERVLRGLEEAEVDCSFVQRAAGKHGAIVIQIDKDGTGKRSFLGYYGGEGEREYSVTHGESVLEGVQWLVAGMGSVAHPRTFQALKTLLDLPCARGIPLLADLNARAHSSVEDARWLARRAAILKASKEDLCTLGLPPGLDTLKELRETEKTGGVDILTLGPEGAIASIPGGEVCVSAVNLDIVDTTGCGDAFTAGILAYLYLYNLQYEGSTPCIYRWGAFSCWGKVLSAGCLFGAIAATEMGATEAFRGVVAYLNAEDELDVEDEMELDWEGQGQKEHGNSKGKGRRDS